MRGHRTGEVGLDAARHRKCGSDAYDASLYFKRYTRDAYKGYKRHKRHGSYSKAMKVAPVHCLLFPVAVAFQCH